MDKFLNKQATWKTLNASSFRKSFGNDSYTGIKTPKSQKPGKKRLSILDERILKIFSSEPDEPLTLNCESNFAYDNFGDGLSKVSRDENIPPLNSEIDRLCQKVYGQQLVEKVQLEDSNMMSCQMSKDNFDVDSDDIITLKTIPYMARIQRDLNSPSAAARIRALKALRSPAKSAYNNFDIPYEEQDIITEDERKTTILPKSIEEVMKNVVIYVEVRTAEDNRSAGVKKVISSLGARVNDRFLRDTTHVVFKDGLQSTYNKAKKWNIPIVSILWIEDCKKHMKLMNPSIFPILNEDRYENPELYKKMKRQKSMQPNAEEKIRRNMSKILKDKKTEINNKTVTINSALRIPRQPKDKLDEILLTFQEQMQNTPEIDYGDYVPLESKLLERIRNSPLNSPKSIKKIRKPISTSLQKVKECLDKIANTDDSSDDFEVTSKSKTPKINARKNLFSESFTKNISTPIDASDTVQIGHNKENPTMITRASHRRSLLPPVNCEKKIVENNEVKKNSERVESPDKGDSSKSNNTLITEEEMQFEKAINGNIRQRRTSLTRKSLDITDIQLEENNSISRSRITSAMKTARRRTLYTPEPMDQSTILSEDTFNKKTPDITETSIKNRRRTLFNPMCVLEEACDITSAVTSEDREIFSKTINDAGIKGPDDQSSLIDEYNARIHFNSRKTPQSIKRRTIFDISMDIIDQRMQNINKSAKRVSLNMCAINRSPVAADSTNLANLNDSLQPYRMNHENIVVCGTKTIPQNEMNPTNPKNLSELETPPVLKKPVTASKRKLFVPAELNLTSYLNTTASQQKSTPNPRRSIALNSCKPKKRQRDEETIPSDIMQSGNKRKKIHVNGSVVKSANKYPFDVAEQKQTRRSTLDFVTIKRITNPKMDEKMLDNNTEKLPVLVYTNMHTQQIDFIKEAVKNLGRFQIEESVSDKTTHVVTLEPRRTINMLRGIIRGLWVLNYNWIVESAEAGKWLHEEQFEVREFSRAVEICRSEREAFGTGYKIDLYTDVAPIYVSSKSTVPSDHLKELLTLCSGKVVESKRKAKYIIGEFCNKYPDVLCLDPLWILDSISINKLKKMNPYILKDKKVK